MRGNTSRGLIGLVAIGMVAAGCTSGGEDDPPQAAPTASTASETEPPALIGDVELVSDELVETAPQRDWAAALVVGGDAPGPIAAGHEVDERGRATPMLWSPAGGHDWPVELPTDGRRWVVPTGGTWHGGELVLLAWMEDRDGYGLWHGTPADGFELRELDVTGDVWVGAPVSHPDHGILLPARLGRDAVVLRLESPGGALTRTVVDTGGTRARANGVAASDDGVVVVGATTDDESRQDAFVARADADGQFEVLEAAPLREGGRSTASDVVAIPDGWLVVGSRGDAVEVGPVAWRVDPDGDVSQDGQFEIDRVGVVTVSGVAAEDVTADGDRVVVTGHYRAWERQDDGSYRQLPASQDVMENLPGVDFGAPVLDAEGRVALTAGGGVLVEAPSDDGVVLQNAPDAWDVDIAHVRAWVTGLLLDDEGGVTAAVDSRVQAGMVGFERRKTDLLRVAPDGEVDIQLTEHGQWTSGLEELDGVPVAFMHASWRYSSSGEHETHLAALTDEPETHRIAQPEGRGGPSPDAWAVRDDRLWLATSTFPEEGTGIRPHVVTVDAELDVAVDQGFQQAVGSALAAPSEVSIACATDEDLFVAVREDDQGRTARAQWHHDGDAWSQVDLSEFGGSYDLVMDRCAEDADGLTLMARDLANEDREVPWVLTSSDGASWEGARVAELANHDVAVMKRTEVGALWVTTHEGRRYLSWRDGEQWRSQDVTEAFGGPDASVSDLVVDGDTLLVAGGLHGRPVLWQAPLRP